MKRLLFLLTLAVYGFSAMDLHEWANVPQVLAHVLEHHSDLGHHDQDGAHHDGTDDHDHSPFEEDCHGEFCACNGLVAVAPVPAGHLLSLAPLSAAVGTAFLLVVPSAFSGNVWNPPKA